MEETVIDDELIERIAALHSGPTRGYHSWNHPLALLRLYRDVRNRLSDPIAVYCAILFHDAIYEPRASDNEARSAALAAELLGGRVDRARLARILALIDATAGHAIPPGLPSGEAADMAMFLDMDLSILGAAADAFDVYEAGVRHEYREIPEAEFRAARARILEDFLDRPVLFLSDWGRGRFEAAARHNLARSVAALRADRR
jgi:predicted metal-dependent HD superfamily phosphohydrolase